MTPERVLKLIEFAKGYWPGVRFDDATVTAWKRALASVDDREAAAAIEAYANEGHPYPPRIGQLVVRCKPPESDQQRARRQRKKALQDLAARRISQETFDWYENDFWSKADPIQT